MSGIGGIHSFNGTHPDQSLLATLSERLAAMGPDGAGSESDRSVGMVYRAFHTTHESHLERQPSRSRRGVLLCFDGRLDNRVELIATLQNELQDDRTDVALVMFGYERWGVDLFAHLIGDFAMSLWDPHLQTLFLARDIVGARDLFYHMNSQRIMWSSDLSALVDLCGVELEVDEKYVAAHLARLAEPGQTPFKGINAVAAAHVTIV